MADAYQIKEQHACYFLTLQVVFWLDIFSRRRYRDIIIEALQYCRKNKGLEIFSYVIMTNHVHLLVRSGNGKLSDTLRDFKKYTSAKILQSIRQEPESRREHLLHQMRYAASRHKRNTQFQLWTHENHAVQIINDEMYRQRINYIHENPVRAGWVEKAEDYLYSSARMVGGGGGLMEIDFMDR